MKVRFAAAGDAMLLTDFPDIYNFQELSNIINSAQIKAVNVEMVLSNRDCFASTFCGGNWINSDPENFSHLQQYGFNLFSCANNHSMDYSFNGVLSTCKAIETRIPSGKGAYAGIGESLAEATKPAYLTIEVGGENLRVALISLTTTFVDAARAGDANEYFPSRPGVNALRHKEVFYCTPEQMSALKSVAIETCINGERDNARKIGSLPPEINGSFNFGGMFFEESEKRGKVTTCHEEDLKRILDTIKDARNNADYVIVMPHSHNIKHNSYTEPDYFFEDFCRKCIDEGADCIFGSGTHQLKPIEIYKNKPIFYSLGNFIFQTHLIDALPKDFWDKYNYSETLTVKEAMKKKSRNGSIGLTTDKNNYLSIIPIVDFEDGICKNIELTVVNLQFEKEEKLKGLPVIGDRSDIEAVFQYLNDISQCYGTTFSIKEDKICIEM